MKLSPVSNKKDFLWRLCLYPETILEFVDASLNLITFNMFWFRFANDYLFWITTYNLKRRMRNDYTL